MPPQSNTGHLRALQRSLALAVCAGALLLLPTVGGGATARAASPPAWTITATAGPTRFLPNNNENVYEITVTNVGETPTEGTVTIADMLPEGVTATEIRGEDSYTIDEEGERFPLTCTLATVTCTYGRPVGPGDTLTVLLTVAVGTGPPSGVLTNQATVSGGTAPTVSTSEPTTTPTAVGSSPIPFGPSGVNAALSNAQAGAHPNLTTSFAFNQARSFVSSGSVKNISVDLPPGFVGNPTATPQCDMDSVLRFTCPSDTAVGVATTRINLSGGASNSSESTEEVVSLIYNVRPYTGEPAAFAFNAIVFPVRLDSSVQRSPNGQYRIHVVAPTLIEGDPVVSSSVTFWGVPAEHNGPGPDTVTANGSFRVQSFGGPGAGVASPFLTNPQVCAGNTLTAGLPAPEAILSVDSWANPGRLTVDGVPDLTDPNWQTSTSPIPTATGCERLVFQPSITARPDTFQADAPAGYTVDLHVPQVNNPHGLATPDLQDARVTLPPGVVVSPSAADGLEGCSDNPGEPSGDQFGLRSLHPATCPSASQIGTVGVTTPLLASPLEGQVFLGQPSCSACTPADAQEGRMIRLFIQAQGSGVIIKLEGTTSVNQSTGQLTTTFDENPQLPFEDLTLTLHGGSKAPLANPSTCGVPLSATSQLTPYSSQTPAEPSSEPFQVTGCPSPQFHPVFSAGTLNNQAGAFSPETVTFSRTDQSQDFEGITVHTPPGLLGMLSKVQLCPQEQAQSGTCSPQSQIGTTTVGAGPGSTPLFLGGRVYLTERYKGAPFGLSIVVPAVAGPFNLGNVIVRAAINVDRTTSALTITSDPLPRSLDGIPLQIKTVNVDVNREGFIFNPTNCQPMAVEGTLRSTQGATAAVSSRYQAANCASLPFTPKFAVLTQAKTSKVNGASLHVKVTSGPGQANIGKVKVDLPKQLPSRLTTLQKACPDATFNANPASCPAASVVGSATAVTPVLNTLLTGPAYLVSHAGAAFPDLVIILQGEGITLDLVGHTDIKHGITISTFNSVPDAPISRFDLVLPEGPHSALAAFGNLCKTKLNMPTAITGQNGAVIKQTTRIAVAGCPKHKEARRTKTHTHRRRAKK